VLDDLRGHKPLADRIHIADSVHRRNVVLDVLNHAQIELMRRIRAAPDASDHEHAREAVFETIAGIAAALQTSG
jgi:phosphoenolpyruvate carboxylase